MAYLIARKKRIAWLPCSKNKHGENLVELKRRLNKAVGYKGIELITISRPTAYVEYAPYQFIDTEQEFEQLVRERFDKG